LNRAAHDLRAAMARRDEGFPDLRENVNRHAPRRFSGSIGETSAVIDVRQAAEPFKRTSTISVTPGAFE
jgi:hypothetical protein